jgi:hypothetical protein
MQPGTIKDPTINQNTVKRKQRSADEANARDLNISVDELDDHLCVLCDRTFLSAETLQTHLDGSH